MMSVKRYNLRLQNRGKINSDQVNAHPIEIIPFKERKQETSKRNDIKTETNVKKRKRPLKETEIENKLVTPKKKQSAKDIPIITLDENGSSSKFVGAHVSIAGGLLNAVTNAVAIGAKSFGLFLRPHMKWNSKPIKSETAALFRQACKDNGFPPHLILPHGQYLLNCGSPDETTLQKSRDTLIEELKRCEMLGIALFNFHPGSTCGKISRDECINRIAESINLAHAETKYVITVIENMCKQGHTVGGDFKELHAIIDSVKDKSRIGVCLDTCHVFAAGYNISHEEGFSKMMTDFENIIGLEYLKAVHLNDSMAEAGCHKDMHENIGKGYIGLKGFGYIMNDDRFNNIPMILETPTEVDDFKEIEMLYKLCK